MKLLPASRTRRIQRNLGSLDSERTAGDLNAGPDAGSFRARRDRTAPFTTVAANSGPSKASAGEGPSRGYSGHRLRSNATSSRH